MNVRSAVGAVLLALTTFVSPAGAATATAQEITAQNVGKLGPAWALQTGGPVRGAVTIDGDTIYAPSEDGHLYAVAASDGKQRWAFHTGGPIWGSPTISGSTVFVGSADDKLYALDKASGRQMWSVAGDADFSGSAVVGDGTVYAGSNDHRLYALDAKTGLVRWTFTAAGALSGTPSLADETVYVGSNDHKLYALDAATGDKRWSATTDGEVWSKPAIADGRVFVISDNTATGHLYAFDARTGAAEWTSADVISGDTNPVVDQGVVYATGRNGLEAVDAKTGAAIWTHASGGNSFSAPIAQFVTPAVVGGLVFSAQSTSPGDSSVIALDRKTGAVVSAYTAPTLGPVFSSPVVRGSMLYFGASDGAVHALAPGATNPATRTATAPPRPPLDFSHRDMLADMLDPDSVTEIRGPGDGIASVSSSLDPRGLNNDYNWFHGLSGGGRQVLMDVHGSGVVTNLFLAGVDITGTSSLTPAIPPPNDPLNVSSSQMTIWVDDNPTPIVDTSTGQFFSGGAGFPFLPPLVSETSAGEAAHVPIPYRKHIKIVMTQAPGDSLFWYDVYYHRFPDDRGVQSYDAERDRQKYQKLVDTWSASLQGSSPRSVQSADVTKTGTMTLAPGESAPLLDVSMPAEITDIRFKHFAAGTPGVTTPDGAGGKTRETEALHKTILSGRWDDEPILAVDAPVDAFFGTGFGQSQNYDSLMFGMHTAANTANPNPQYEHPSELSEPQGALGVTTYNRYPMPFAKHGELMLKNALAAGQSAVTVDYAVTYRPLPIVRKGERLFRGSTEIGYFHATPFHNRQDARDSPHPDRDAADQMADYYGRGNLAGTVLNMTTHNFGSGGDVNPTWQEGDCEFWIDDAGDYLPSVTSTGHEECFDGGFYFQNLQNNPTAGVTKRDLAAAAPLGAGNYTDEISVFHQYLGDAINFQNRLQATVEHGTNNGFDKVDESGLAFSYLVPGAVASIDAPGVVAIKAKTRCASRRRFTIHLRVPRALRPQVASATVLVGGKRAAVRRGRRLTSTITLRGIKRGRFTVRVRVRLKNGRVLKETRRYRTCTKKKKKKVTTKHATVPRSRP